MQTHEERPGSVSREDEEAEQVADCVSARVALQVPVIVRMDAIAQLLFSAGLIADVLQRLWERDPQEGRSRRAELALLTYGALAEVRILLGELRLSELLEGDQTGACIEKER